MQAEDSGDVVTFMFEAKNNERISDFELKLMDIDSEQLGIPDTDYAATVKMPSAEFQRIIKCAPMPVSLLKSAGRRSVPDKARRVVCTRLSAPEGCPLLSGVGCLVRCFKRKL